MIKNWLIKLTLKMVNDDYRGLAINNEENNYAGGESRTNHLILVDREGFYNEFIIGSGLLSDTFQIQNEQIKNIKDLSIFEIIALLIRLRVEDKKITPKEIETLFQNNRNKDEITNFLLSSNYLNERMPGIKDVIQSKIRMNRNN